MSIVLKYGETFRSFSGKLIATRSDDCHDCGKNLFRSERYEKITDVYLDVICGECFEVSQRGKKILNNKPMCFYCEYQAKRTSLTLVIGNKTEYICRECELRYEY